MLLELTGLSKRFGPVEVLSDVDLSIDAGEVCALVGDNGAGKSTLVKCVAGIHGIDGGAIAVDGEARTIAGPRDAAALGIEVVYQDLALCDNLDVVENLFLGREKVHGLVLDDDAMEQLAAETLSSLAVRTIRNLRQPVASLSGGQRQTVAIAKAVLWNSRLVILDEPTAALGVAQTRQVLELIRRLADQGLAVLYISHNLNDVFAVADRIAALYLGRMAAVLDAADATQSQVVELITSGRSGSLGLGAGHERSPDVSTRVETRPEAGTEPGAVRAVADHLRGYWAEVRSGEVGALPAVAGIIALCAFFGISQPVFLSVGNLANLFGQGAAVACIAMGLVFVLVIGEIDLSAGFASGVCAAVMAVILTNWGMPWPVAIGAAIATGVVIGLLLGTLVVKLGIPSFVVTLAAFLAFQGIVLMILEEGSNITIHNETVKAVAGGNLERWQGWTLLVLTIAAYGALQLSRWRRRVARSLVHEPLAVVAARVIALGALLTATVFLLNLERSANPQIISLTGVPVVVAILGAFFAIWTFVLHRTRFGRHLYAVGGNAEAAVRAGVNVDRVRIAAFVICSGMAAIGGIVAASRAASVDPNTGGSNVLLLSVGAAVIGGASLFGGKGTVRAALLGGAVVAIINNGMGLMGLSAGVRFGVTGAVLLLAAGVDAMSRGRGKLFGRH